MKNHVLRGAAVLLILVIPLSGCEFFIDPLETGGALAESESPREEIDAGGVSIADREYDLIAWSLGCSAILAVCNGFPDPYEYGMHSLTSGNAQKAKASLGNSWSIQNRDDLVDTITRMTDGGHNLSFLEYYEFIVSLTDDEYLDLLALSDEFDAFMFDLSKTIGDKWDDRQIKAWDWFRMFHIAGWSYVAGYIELNEAYDLLEPVIERLLDTFSSWEEACENYLDGYLWWSCGNFDEYERRYDIYEDLLTLPPKQRFFDPSLW